MRRWRVKSQSVFSRAALPFLFFLACLPLLASSAISADPPVDTPASNSTVAFALSETEEEVLDKSVPETIEDLKVIESVTKRLSDKLTAVTVGISIGRAQGSGVIVSEDGYVLTAAHVSGKPDRDATIILPNGDRVRGKTLGLNRGVDAGMIKITSEGKWPYAEMGQLNKVQVGDWCVAVGHPGGFQNGRSPVVRLGRVVVASDNVIQSDCTLVGGDSGGPLFDMTGRVIGVNSRIGVRTSWNFHVPISAYRSDWDELIAGNELRSSRGGLAGGAILGVNGEDDAQGCRVTRVAPGFPAEESGLQEGDIITHIDDVEIDGFDSLATTIRKRKPGEKITITFLRGENVQKKTAVLAERE